MSDCHICLGPHDSETHEATVRLREWFRSRVMLALQQSEANDERFHKPWPEPRERATAPAPIPVPEEIFPEPEPEPEPPPMSEPEACGKRMGRPGKVDEAHLARLKAEGLPMSHIARVLGVSRAALYLPKHNPAHRNPTKLLSSQQRHVVKAMQAGEHIYDRKQGTHDGMGVSARLIRSLLQRAIIEPCSPEGGMYRAKEMARA